MFFSLTPFCQNLHANRRGYHPYWLSQQIQIKIWNLLEICCRSIVKKDLRSICFYIHPLSSTSAPKPQNVSNGDINPASPRRGWVKPGALPQPKSVGCPVLSKEHCAPWLASAVSEKGTEMRSKDSWSLWKELHYRPQESSSPFKDGGKKKGKKNFRLILIYIFKFYASSFGIVF